MHMYTRYIEQYTTHIILSVFAQFLIRNEKKTKKEKEKNKKTHIIRMIGPTFPHFFSLPLSTFLDNFFLT